MPRENYPTARSRSATCPQIMGMCTSRLGITCRRARKKTKIASPKQDARLHHPPQVTSSGESQASRGVAASCEIPLEVHGSQKGGTQYHTVTPFHEETRTVIVFPHGCVLRLSTPVTVGQMLALTNQNTQRGMLSRVTHVRSYPNLKSYVEIEFTQADPDFWSIDFAEEGATQGYMPSQSPACSRIRHGAGFLEHGRSGCARANFARAVPIRGKRSTVFRRTHSSPCAGASISGGTTGSELTERQSGQAKKRRRQGNCAAAENSGIFNRAAAAQEKAAEEPPSSQAWAELLVMEPEQQQLSAQQLSTTRSDVEESLAPDSSHEDDAHGAASPSFDPEHPEPVSASVLKELEKLALEHVSGAASVGESDPHLAENASTAAKQRAQSASGKKQAEQSNSGQSKDSRAAKRAGFLGSLTGGAKSRDTKSSPLHSFTGAPPAGDSKQNPLHSFTPLPPAAESLPGEVHGTNPHKTQSLADQTPDSGEESDFGNFLRDPEPRTAEQHVFAGHGNAAAPRSAELHATLAPLKAKKSKSGMVLAGLTCRVASNCRLVVLSDAWRGAAEHRGSGSFGALARGFSVAVAVAVALRCCDA